MGEFPQKWASLLPASVERVSHFFHPGSTRNPKASNSPHGIVFFPLIGIFHKGVPDLNGRCWHIKIVGIPFVDIGLGLVVVGIPLSKRESPQWNSVAWPLGGCCIHWNTVRRLYPETFWGPFFRWWFQTSPGEMIQFGEHILQMGWNHQLVLFWDVRKHSYLQCAQWSKAGNIWVFD